MKNVLIINGHPDKESFNHALSGAYLEGAMHSKAEVSTLNISDLEFNPNLQYGYRERTNLEPDLLNAIEMIKRANHIVWVFPMWWYGYPALMKGFIDRTFLPGITFQPIPGKAFPEKLLKGKSARVIITSDTPKWYDRFFMGRPAVNQFKRGTLNFCGISPVKVTYIAPIKDSSLAFREKWLKKVSLLGHNLK
ncbi:MAG: NAD(P)H-dependent oxidoreductase [Flavobacteriales bacterium]|nr:NAD(P)H-dependent oxidoreductase [Flavobacteriales bacterium]